MRSLLHHILSLISANLASGKESSRVKFLFYCSAGAIISLLHELVLPQIYWAQDHLAYSLSQITCKLPFSVTFLPYMQPPPYILLFHYSVFLVLPLLLPFYSCQRLLRMTKSNWKKKRWEQKGNTIGLLPQICFCDFKFNMSAKLTVFLYFASFLWKHGIKQMTLLSLKTMFRASS